MEIDTSFETRFEQLDALLSKAGLGSKKVVRVANYHSPNIQFRSWAILCPDGYILTDESPVVHGHPVERRFCLATDYCHIQSYRPTGKERPSFIEGFYRKWDYERLH